jgi:hypothetical protein
VSLFTFHVGRSNINFDGERRLRGGEESLFTFDVKRSHFSHYFDVKRSHFSHLIFEMVESLF